MKTLIIGSQKDSIVKAQIEPFSYNKKILSRQLNIDYKYVPKETFLDIGETSKNSEYDLLLIIPFWGENPIESEKVIKEIRESNPNQKLIFIDPWAQVSSTYFNLLPYVDWFLKRQRYKNLNEYKKKFIGGSMFTDFLANHWQYDFDDWYVGSEVPEGYENRIISGWNLGTAKKFKDELFSWKLWQRSFEKDVDIFCRMSLGNANKKEWYFNYRATSIEALKPLESDYKMAVSGGFTGESLIPRRQYYNELRRSKIVFSPFGWGENCWRDFEAICYDCLLVKPSMAHIDTQPNIFIEDETYVPVKWDFSDLVEKCRYYLKHPDEATKIVKNARRVYKAYFEEMEFVKTIELMIR